MQDNFSMHEWRLNQAIQETEKIKGKDGKGCWKGYRYAGTENGKDKCVPINEGEKGQCPDCGCEMEGQICNECGYAMEEGATFTNKFDDSPELKGGQKDLPDEVQSKIVKSEGEIGSDFNKNIEDFIAKHINIIKDAANFYKKQDEDYEYSLIETIYNFLEQELGEDWTTQIITPDPEDKKDFTYGWTDDKDEIFYNALKSVLSKKNIKEGHSSLTHIDKIDAILDNLLRNVSTDSTIPTRTKEGLLNAFKELQGHIEDLGFELEVDNEDTTN